MRRVCFTLQVRPERLAEYRARHAAVWPEMLRALRDAGWHDYQLFLRDDGLVVGTARVEGAGGLAAAQAAVDALPVSARWETAMAPLFTAGGDGRGKSDLELVFDLDAQLGAIGEPTTASTGDTP